MCDGLLDVLSWQISDSSDRRKLANGFVSRLRGPYIDGVLDPTRKRADVLRLVAGNRNDHKVRRRGSAAGHTRAFAAANRALSVRDVELSEAVEALG